MFPGDTLSGADGKQTAWPTPRAQMPSASTLAIAVAVALRLGMAAADIDMEAEARCMAPHDLVDQSQNSATTRGKARASR